MSGATRATIIDNRIAENKDTGIYMKNASQAPTIRDNRIFDNVKIGINVNGMSWAFIEDNRIVKNRNSGIDIHDGVEVALKDNQITGSNFGVGLFEPTGGKFEGAVRGKANQIAGNTSCDVPPCLQFLKRPVEGCYGKKCK